VKAERSGSGEIMRHVTPLYFPDNLETARLTAPALPTCAAGALSDAAPVRGRAVRVWPATALTSVFH
jgi:hypothetical protein